MLIYRRDFFHICFLLTFFFFQLKNRSIGFLFKNKTEFNQAMKLAVYSRNFSKPFLGVKNVQLTIKYVVEYFPPISRFRF